MTAHMRSVPRRGGGQVKAVEWSAPLRPVLYLGNGEQGGEEAEAEAEAEAMGGGGEGSAYTVERLRTADSSGLDGLRRLID